MESHLKKESQRSATGPLEAQVLFKHKEMFEASESCSHILTNLRERNLISEIEAARISRLHENKAKQNGELIESIVNVVADYRGFVKFCASLIHETDYSDFLYSIVQYYSICFVVSSCDYIQLYFLITALTKHKILEEAECDIIDKKDDKNAYLLNILHSKPIDGYLFLKALCKEKLVQSLHSQILEKVPKVLNDIRLIPPKKLSISTTDIVATNTTTTSTTTTSISTATQNFTVASSLSDVMVNYQANLKQVYNNLPEISTQGWFCTTQNDTQKKFINISLVKSVVEDERNVEEYCSSPKMIKGEVVYSTDEYVHYDKIFEVDSSTHQLFLFEGNPGTGKTSFTYKVLKMWAEGNVLQQYSFIVLVELQKLKPTAAVSLETLFATMGQSISNKICKGISKLHGNGTMIWLEGWDELDDSFVCNSIIEDLLYGKVLPQATIVITTRPSATRSLEGFSFTHKFKIIGFVKQQIEKYVSRYCATDSQSFMANLNVVPDLLCLAKIPLYLAILVKLFNAKRELPKKLTDLCCDLLMICLQHHKGRLLRDNQPIQGFDKLPARDKFDMQSIFYCMQKCAYERLLSHGHHIQRALTEQEISQDFFDFKEVPNNFDGLGLFSVRNTTCITGISKTYDFQYKPIQELLAALYLSRLKPTDLIEELSEIFNNKKYEMVWVFYAGITDLKQVPIGDLLKKHKMPLMQQSTIKFYLPVKSLKDLVETWKQCCICYTDTTDNFSIEFLLSLILCCYEAKNSKACRDIAAHLYADKVCRFEIPPNHVTPYLLLAVSFFIAHSGKTWSLRCNTVIHGQSTVQLLSEHINDPDPSIYYPQAASRLWVFCCVVTSSEIDAYCSVISSQLSLQWIQLLPGSCLGDDGTRKLCECLHSNERLLMIEMSNCGIGSDGLRSIGCLLNKNKNILYVDLRKNAFKLDDFKALFLNIKNQQLLHLQSLVLDKSYCENPEIREILEEINLQRAKINAISLNIDYQTININ